MMMRILAWGKKLISIVVARVKNSCPHSARTINFHEQAQNRPKKSILWVSENPFFRPICQEMLVCPTASRILIIHGNYFNLIGVRFELWHLEIGKRVTQRISELETLRCKIDVSEHSVLFRTIRRAGKEPTIRAAYN